MPRPTLPTSPATALAPLIGQLMLGVGGFRESSFVSDEGGLGDRTGSLGLRHQWGHPLARALRYGVFWGHYEGNVYREIHRYADEMKEQFGLYDFIRPIFNPAYRLVEFYAQHLMGGTLDRKAGDGAAVASALPILADNELIRPGIAKVWRDSNWQAKKETFTRYGAAMGDSPLMVADDPGRRCVTLKPIHPRTLTYFDRDDYGNCRAYRLDDWKPDPEFDLRLGVPPLVRYSETCVQVGESIVFTTYREGVEYDWRDYPEGLPEGRRVGPTWTEDYGFVPLVLVQHRDMGLGWGWSEMQPSLAKLHELDDAASKLGDALRVAVDPLWFYAGVADDDVSFAADDETNGDDDAAGRSRIKALYAKDPAAKAQALVFPLDIAAASAHIMKLVEEVQRDHPELNEDKAGAGASGASRRIDRERKEALVAQRRAGYDDGLVRAHQMCLSIGGAKGYPGFEGITADSYARGDLEHSIGDRGVFAVDEMDRIAEKQARAGVLKMLTDSGVPIVEAMEEAGYPSELIARVKAGAAKAAQAAQQQQAASANTGQDATGSPQ